MTGKYLRKSDKVVGATKYITPKENSQEELHHQYS
jgi:hypothetical protein